MKSEEWKQVGPTTKAFACTFVKGLPGHEESNANSKATAVTQMGWDNQEDMDQEFISTNRSC